MTSRTQQLAGVIGCILATGLSPMSAAADAQTTARQVAAGTLLGRTDASRTVTLALTLPSRDPNGAAAFVAHVTKPGDSLFHRYVTPEQYAARFGAAPADYDAVVAWAQSHGLTVGERFTARTVVPVTGTVSAIEAALGTSFSDYRDAQGRVFYAALGVERLPEPLVGKVAGIVGLSSQAHFAPQVKMLPAGARPQESGTGPGKAFSAADLRTAYSVPAQTLGPKQKLALFEQGGFDPNDVAIYAKRNNLPNVTLKVRGVDGYGGGIDSPGIELEAVLDIDMLTAVNPQASEISVYEDGNDSFGVALLDALSAMASDDTAQTISISYGIDETLQGTTALTAENTVLTQMAAQGQAVFASSGDNGAYGDFSSQFPVSDPASQPLVTGVGGTTLLTGQKEAYEYEIVWNELAQGGGGSGGGISLQWPIPEYQAPGGFAATTANGGSATMRNVPDIAAVGDPLTGVAVYSALNGGWVTVGGTSVASPIWAGFWSLVNAASEGLGFGAAGFANPGIYAINLGGPALVYPLGVQDVTYGSNGDPGFGGGYSAGYSYDNTTGFGSFSGQNLLVNLAVAPAASGTNPPPIPKELKATATPTSIHVTWTGAKGDSGFLVFALTQSFQTVEVALQKERSATLTGLVPGKTYVVQIVAISPGGETVSPPDYVTTPKS